jgi:preprotein translocase subunit YajC
MTFYTPASAILAQSSSGGGIGSILLPMALFMVAMYFFMIAPQRKKEKQHKAMLASLKTGDRVLTIGGIYGTITAVKEDRYHLKVDESTRIEILKSAVQGRQPEASGDTTK